MFVLLVQHFNIFFKYCQFIDMQRSIASGFNALALLGGI